MEAEIVIVGGGIVGVSTAYFLSQRGKSALIVEATEVACAASGKAGGFLARDWGDADTQPLHQKGYALIAELSKQLGVESYRELPALSVCQDSQRRKGKNVAKWLNDQSFSSKILDTHTAQVTPPELISKMLTVAESHGTSVVKGSVSRVNIEAGTVTGVQLTDGRLLRCKQVVFCLGPWSGAVEQWFGSDVIRVPMTGIKSTALIYDANSLDMPQEPYALFCDEDSNECHLEVYLRPNGHVYVCGCGGSDHVSGSRLDAGGDCGVADGVTPDTTRARAAQSSLGRLCPSLASFTPHTIQACMRPFLPDGKPMIGTIPKTKNAFICAGHNCWGILWGPVSGLVMAQLLCGEQCDIPLPPFDPARFL